VSENHSCFDSSDTQEKPLAGFINTVLIQIEIFLLLTPQSPASGYQRFKKRGFF